MTKLPHLALWVPNLEGRGGPLYLAISEAIAADIAEGRLKPGTRLPAQRVLAEALDIDFTTVTRAYAEARKRGLLEGHVGHGTYVRQKENAGKPSSRRSIDVSMNLPPRFESPAVEARMEAGIASVASDGVDLLLAYQDPAGGLADRQAGATWLAPRLPDVALKRILVCPGAQGALTAVLGLLAERGDVICAESLTYPGLLALTSHLGIRIAPLAMDDEGVLPESFAATCKSEKPKLLYCTPTLHNPTTATMSLSRRKQIVEIAMKHGVQIIEDDAYGALPRTPIPPLATLAPEMVWYIGGLAKCLSPALRLAFLVAPDARMAARAASAIRAFSGMASPFTAAIATRWIEDGTAGEVLAAIREETAMRQQVTARILPTAITKPDCFHAWLTLPEGWTAGTLASRARLEGVGLVTADAFAVDKAPDAVRLGLGAPRSLANLTEGLEIVADLLARPPRSSSNIV